VAQHDYVIANGTGAAVRSDLNNALAAIVSNNSGTTEPTTTYAYMRWADTTAGVMKMRNGANNAWITLYQLDGEWSTIAFENGSASAPSIYFKDSGTDTGIYSPGTDQVAISTAGTGRLFVDASGRLLVGTSTARSNVAGQVPQLQLEGLGVPASTLSLTNNAADAGGGYIFLTKTRGTSIGSNTIVQNNDVLGGLYFVGADGVNTQAAAAYIQGEVDGTPGANDMPGRLIFATTADGANTPTERMRINALGQTIVESGTNTFTAVTSAAGSVSVACWNKASSSDNKFIDFVTEAGYTTRGGIDYNRAAGQVRYNVTSDERLKENIEDASAASTLLSSIKVRSYIWKETGYKVEHGFVAQELNQIVPDAVKVGDDGDEVLDAWAVDNGKLVPLLTKALQEAIAKIETLEAKVAALEAQ